MSIEDEYMDVLQNIEFGIVSAYRSDANVSDYDVLDALEALISHYYSERINRPPRNFRLDQRAQAVYDSAKAMCEMRLGRGGLEDKKGKLIDTGMEALSIQEIIDCLKRIQSSVKKWSKRYGRQGYLTFVKDYVK
jgi:hypothetical protein